MPLDVDAARELVLAHTVALPAQPCALLDALGRRLAADLVATSQHPRADNSAMDGYAVRCADLADAAPGRPVPLTLVGASEAGRPFAGRCAAGRTVRILTGGLVPAGADAVVQQELVRLADDGRTVTFTRPPRPGNDIRRAGEEWLPGDLLLPAGSRLTPAALGLLAAAGCDRPLVHARPRVALAVTGDELCGDPAQPVGDAVVHDANTPLLAAWLTEQGATVVTTACLPDDRDAVAAWLADAATRADVIVTAGGASVGDRDVVGVAWEQAGLTTAFWGVAMKPGKPVRFGWLTRAGESPVLAFALPGNPLSALAGCEQFVEPCLTVLAGGQWRPPPRLRLPLAQPWGASRGRRYLLRAVAQGEPLALTLSPRQGSAILREAAQQALVAHLDGRPRDAGSGVEAAADPDALRGLVLRPVAPLPAVCGVRGFAKVGKTRLLELLIPRLREAGLRVGTIKHAHHTPAIDTPGSDTHRHAQAGAEQVVLIAPEVALLVARQAGEESPWSWLEAFAGQVDLVLVEGFKDRLMPHITVEARDGADFALEPEAGDLPAWRLLRPADAPPEDLWPAPLVDALAAHLIDLGGAR